MPTFDRRRRSHAAAEATQREAAPRETLPPAPAADSGAAAAPVAPLSLAPPSAALVHSRAVVEALFGPPRERGFDLRYWDGTLEPAGVQPAPYALVLRRPGALRRMLLPPSELAIAESYLDGDVDIDGDLEAAVTIGDAIAARMRSPGAIARVTRHLLALPRVGSPAARGEGSDGIVRRAGREHDPARDRAAISYHYDVGNDFYQLWLDERMVYSCAFFRSPDDSLDEAQRAKLDLVCRKLRLRPGERFLDVGCGWGALIVHAVRHYGVTALGITLSEAQAALARARIAAAGLADRCRVEIRDYRDLPADARFDKIASVGMVEHVGLEKLPVYFASLHRALAPAGLLMNHGIVSVERARPATWRQRLEHRVWRRDGFIHRYVFPDGTLVPFREVVGAAEAAGFETRDVESLREHYALTLRAWVARLTARSEHAIALVGERRYRTWKLYMTASAQAFSSGAINIVQTLLAKPDRGRSALPLTRDDILLPAWAPTA